MRLRNIKGSREAIAMSPYVINDPESMRGEWRKFFKNNNPLHIEVGMGKGRFISELAALNPEINYVGIEKYSSVLFRALEKMEELKLRNLCFIRMEAENICNVFAENEADRIYLNFSDPWPKDRHAKRRLTSRDFFSRYEKILSPEGRVEFKTDNNELFNFSLEQIGEAGWHIDALTRDLHHDPSMNVNNVMTEYEERFSSMGNPINKLIASKSQK